MTHELKDVPIDAVREYERNAKLHTDEQIGRIAESIKQFGFNQPIAVDEEMILLAGHGRLAAARLLGLSHVPTVVVHGLTNNQKRAFRIADNKLNTDTGFDFAALQIEIEQLTGESFDLDALGLNFSFADLDLGGDREQDVDRTSDKKVDYDNNTVKQIVLYFEGKEYENVLTKLDSIIAADPQIRNNTEAFLKLLKYYDENPRA